MRAEVTMKKETLARSMKDGEGEGLVADTASPTDAVLAEDQGQPVTSELSVFLLSAASAGDVAEARRLLKAGADIEARNDKQHTSLHLAVLALSSPLVNLLIRADADVSAVGGTGETPLHLAIANELLTISKALLSAGASLEACDNIGGSPLHYAALSGNKRIVRLLSSYGADLDALDNEGRSVADWALLGGHLAIADLVAEMRLLRAVTEE